MSRNLVIINELFPFGKGESFLETEINYFMQFDRVLIIPCSAQGYSQTRNIPHANLKTVKCKEKTGIVLKLAKVLRYTKALFNPTVIAEIQRLKSIKKLNKSVLLGLLSFVSVGEHHLKMIDKYLKKDGYCKSDKIIFYSYWMHFHSYIAIKLKKKYPNSKAISRCHNFDLYEYRNKNNYIPLRPYLLGNLDVIYCISDDGKRYLEQKYPNVEKNIQVSRLGSIDNGIKNVNVSRNPLKIVSCSFVSPVKRLERIIGALSKIENININWTHFGDGESFENLKATAKQKLKSNIIYELKGNMSNTDILETYKTQDFHIFLNVSESEGVPVSIMEAISFGIPVIATDVGGVKEIVADQQNGFLIGKDFSDEDLVFYINKIYDMNESEYAELRKKARDFWEKHYNADLNYKSFVNNILSLN